MSSNPPKQRRVLLASDAFGTPLKTALMAHLRHDRSLILSDLGEDTYYDAAARVAKAVRASAAKNDVSATDGGDCGALGVLLCGTGMGVGIVANKFSGVRAATCENVAAAAAARAVNNANVLCLGRMVTPAAEAAAIADAFIAQRFIERPAGADGRPVQWWSEEVERFLAGSSDGIERVERDAAERG